ncbi:two-component system, response regulator YesN [Cohnella sp. OV330]|uniref:helix-turn-helix domain-containing protein n=1 Tax=Cohnella sp. OV330 TaxID=1855288 RepID=UPI0008E7E898|nr:helix-turn-helix domain-containing protein [Cohnella sp. OV330]SFB14248.1 two-component system, response regulator YesN [Cohnella sp. OV330]
MREKTIKLCIIDDIRSVVDMISRKPPWSEHGIEIAGTALDGEAGIALVRETKPDIVLTDIRMPKMDGLAMTQAILEIAPSTKIVILSAYTDFAYTRQAIRLGAFDFVKKPFSIDEIVSVVLKAKAACQSEREALAQRLSEERTMRDGVPALQQEYVSLLVHRAASADTAAAQWERLGIRLAPEQFGLFVIELDRPIDHIEEMPAREVALLRFSIRNILEETIAGHTQGIVLSEAANRFVCLVNCADNEAAERISEACRSNIRRYTRSTVSVGVGRYAATVEALPVAYEQALSALEYRFYTEGNGVRLFDRAGDEPARALPMYSAATEHELLLALRSGRADQCQLVLERIFNELLQSEPLPAPRHVEHLCYELAAKICRTMREFFATERVLALEDRWLAAYGVRGASFQSMKASVVSIGREACSWIEGERADEPTKLIYRAKAYICDNLQADLSVEHCAKRFNISPGYFSNLFKKVMGISYQQFVIHQRMEKAKEMLVEGRQVQEIASALGYEHRRYFSESFKKHTHMTPSEYKWYSTGKLDSPIDGTHES